MTDDEERRGVTVWFTGLPSAGKSTVSRVVARRLRALGHRVEILDGDEQRRALCSDLGFSAEDRRTNVRRIAYVAELLARHGVIVLVPVIAPHADARAEARAHHDRHRTPYLEAYVDTPVELCERRDVKGLYREHRAGRLSGLTGVDDRYDAPQDPDVLVPTAGLDPEASSDVVLTNLFRRGHLTTRPCRYVDGDGRTARNDTGGTDDRLSRV